MTTVPGLPAFSSFEENVKAPAVNKPVGLPPYMYEAALGDNLSLCLGSSPHITIASVQMNHINSREFLFELLADLFKKGIKS